MGTNLLLLLFIFGGRDQKVHTCMYLFYYWAISPIASVFQVYKSIFMYSYLELQFINRPLMISPMLLLQRYYLSRRYYITICATYPQKPAHPVSEELPSVRLTLELPVALLWEQDVKHWPLPRGPFAGSSRSDSLLWKITGPGSAAHFPEGPGSCLQAHTCLFWAVYQFSTAIFNFIMLK